MNFSRLKNSFEELRLLGIEGSLFRVYYEFGLKTGLKKVQNHIPVSKTDIDAWQKKRKKSFFPSISEAKGGLDTLLPEESKRGVIDLAEKATKGEIYCFSKWYGNYGNPINWHLNPLKGVSWPSNVHWSKVMQYEKDCGDIKLTWEVSRFPHVYYLVRAYVLTGNSTYVNEFCNQLRSWDEQNPYGHGVNWYNGQELAIRLLSWIYAVYMMGDDDGFSEEDFERFLKLLYIHTKHIDENINYAYYAVHNNHLIGEALGLYVSGTLFPYFSESERWRKKGKDILEGKRCTGQFYNDGGYCQLSFNYHRLALHYYLWALRVAELNGDEFDREIYVILDRSARFLYSCMNLEDGTLPNWGANDGALLNPWTTCDYRDYRPLVNALSYITRKKRVFESGPWDEELLWFFGKKSLSSEIEPYHLKSESYSTTGLHILRNSENTFGTFRCGTVRDRFGQADQLHVDIWWKGLNIAIDGGSYLYNDELQYHKYFMGTRSHNTVTVDNQDQMFFYRRFKWLYWTKAYLVNFLNNYAKGEHYGYKRLGDNITHRRAFKALDESSFLIEDFLTQNGDTVHSFDLHWLINDFPYTESRVSGRKYVITFETPKGSYYLLLESDKDAELTINRAKDDVVNPDGWQSGYYGEKCPALSVHLLCNSENGCKFTSLFTEKSMVKMKGLIEDPF
ncbi:MAG: alginate lyase family protein [wastewater metagenome]|nr:alginate lyase family protein [Candidatus Loosdrechtia aerotolerans]